MKKNFVLLFTLCAIPALLQAADDKEVAFLQAARNLDHKAIDSYLKEGGDVNVVDNGGNSALMLTVWRMKGRSNQAMERLLEESSINIETTNVRSQSVYDFIAIREQQENVFVVDIWDDVLEFVQIAHRGQKNGGDK